MKKEIPKVPLRFIETNTVDRMQVGQVAYISPLFNVTCDGNMTLWVYRFALTSSQILERTIPRIVLGDGPTPALAAINDDNSLKIERTEDGYKLFIHEYFDFLRNQRFECFDIEKCEAGKREKGCVCKVVLRRSLFKMQEIHPKETLIQITEFDNPKENINDPTFLSNLTSENLAGLSIKELQILLANSTDDENYAVADMIAKEIAKRTD